MRLMRRNSFFLCLAGAIIAFLLFVVQGRGPKDEFVPEVVPKSVVPESVEVGDRKRLNVLLLIADDMRAELGSYVDPVTQPALYPKIHTPHLDKLAKKSLLLKRAYVQQALCSPSRTSFLTGRRPDTTRVYDIGAYWRESGGNFTTLPQYFKEQGYTTAGFGKVFHRLFPNGLDDPPSWTYGGFQFDKTYWNDARKYVWSYADDDKLAEHPLEDMQIIERSTRALKSLAKKRRTTNQPFFLAVGLHRPHLPLLCPKSFFDLYPRKEIGLPKHPYAPQGMPDIAWSNYGGVRRYKRVSELKHHGSINTTLPDNLTKDIRRAYYACVSYVDDLFGSILNTLKKLGLEDDTVVSFLGDHGYQLGEHGIWEKQTNFELANHAPLMISVPGVTDKGVVSNALVEFVDLFPTLVEAAGLPPVPTCPKESRDVILCHEGLSFVPLLTHPKRPWKKVAFSQYPRMTLEGEYVMGYSIKTDRFRYTEWVKMGFCATDYIGRPVKKKELYDHTLDPHETVNRCLFKEYRDIVEELHQMVVDGWTEALL